MTPPEDVTVTTEAPVLPGVGITIDGTEIRAEPGELLIAAAERTGTYIPRFCYHHRMRSVGMCRMCLVEVDTPRGPQLQVSCMVPVADGMNVSTQSPTVKKAQDGVLEFLLANHPLDCPVCDKGGECPLQDQTLAFGPGETRFVEEKRHYEKPIPISDLVLLDRERCILCDRCTRFADEVAGDPLIQFVNRGAQTEINTFPDLPFSSYFSGNTVQLCPVGALTAKPYRFKARPWDLEQVESTCTTCSVGCRVAVQSSQNELTRLIGLDSEPVNHSWLCDKGRFAFEAVNSDNRFTAPQVRVGEALVNVTWSEALSRVDAAITEAIIKSGPESIAFIGGARLTNEDAFAWSWLAKGVIGTDHVDAQLGDGLPAEAIVGLPQATIEEVVAADTIVLIGPDIKEELPVLYLRLRTAAVEHGRKIIELSPTRTGLSDYAAQHLSVLPGELAIVVDALFTGATNEVGGTDPQAFAAAQSLLAGSVAVVVGRSNLAENQHATVDAARVIVGHRPDAKFLPVVRRGNVRGAIDAGLAPGFLPGRLTLDAGAQTFRDAGWKVPASRGLDTAGILDAAANGDIELLVLVGADPLGDFPDRNQALEALKNVPTVVAVATHANASTEHAAVVLPAAAWAERHGTTTNIEGRVTRTGQKVVPPGVAWPDWMIALELGRMLDADFENPTVEGIQQYMSSVSALHEPLAHVDLGAKAHADGVVLQSTPVSFSLPGSIAGPTAPGRDAYALRLVLSRKLYDDSTAVASSSSLAHLGRRPDVLEVHPSALGGLNIESGRVRVVGPAGTTEMNVQGNDSVPRGVARATFATTSAVRDVVRAGDDVCDIKLESVS